jgi:xanthine dehydrogenase accessory factor
MNAQTRATAFQWHADGRPAIVVVVLESRGSVPRKAGTRMIVSAADTAGTLGGGPLEERAVGEARALLQSGSPGRSIGIALGPQLGQACGGALTLGFMRLDARALAVWPEPRPLFHLQMYGAGTLGRAVARLLSTIDCRVDWIDEREELFPNTLVDGAYWPSHVRSICIDDMVGEVRNAPPEAYYLVLTAQHELDLRIAEAVLRRGDFGFVGVLGSQQKRERFIAEFEARGVPPERIARLTCPIGLPGIGGKEPELVALSVVAQLLSDDDV